MSGHIEDLWRTGVGSNRKKTARFGTDANRWRVRWVSPENGNRASKTFPNLDLAKQWMSQVTIDIARGTYVDQKISKKTDVAMMAEIWIASLQVKENTLNSYKAALRNHILPKWGEMSLQSIKHSEVASWVSEMRASGKSYSTAHHALVNFIQILDLAVKDNRLAGNPAIGIKMGSESKKSKQFLTMKQVEQLAEASGEFGLMVRVLAATGMRFGEMAALRVDDFNPKTRRISISKSVTEVNGKMIVGTTKTNKERQVPLPQYLVQAISNEIDARGASAKDVLFPDSNGEMVNNRNWRKRVFIRSLQALGDDFPDITPHSLRHTAASLAIASGADIKVIQLMLGHSSAKMTLDQYGHLLPDRLDEVMESMARLRSVS